MKNFAKSILPTLALLVVGWQVLKAVDPIVRSPSTLTANLPLVGNGSQSLTTLVNGVFTPVVSGSWSALGSGGAIASITGAQGGTAMQVTGASGSTTNWAGAQIAVAGTSWTKTFAVYPFNFDQNVSQTAVSVFMIGFTDGTKAEGVSLFVNGLATGSGLDIGGISTTNVTGGTIANAGGLVTITPAAGWPIWIQCTRATNTYSCGYSPDGINYKTIFSESAPFQTATGVAVIGSTRSAGGTTAPSLLVESWT